VIKTFRSKDTEALFNRQSCPRFQSIENAARRKLTMLNNAQSLQDLRVPPGNRLEELHGDPHGEHSIRINDQWRVCFVWRERDAYDVEIMDYHQERCSDEPDQKAATDSSG
jgi:proteic killer suppression protein